MKSYILVLTLASSLIANANIKYSINDNWSFQREGESKPQRLDLPHTWNAEDVMDDVPGYFRGKGFYKKNLNLGSEIEGKKVFLNFEGANQETQVKVNGTDAGHHIGGYSSFVVDITPYIQQGDNLIEITVDNEHNPDIPPLGADFNFFGGIYRDVFVEIEEPVHFSKSDFASSGIYVSTPEVSSEQANLQIRTLIDNYTDKAKQLAVDYVIKNPEGEIVEKASKNIKLNPMSSLSDFQADFVLKNPMLWSPANPQLYSLTTTITDTKTKKILDTATTTFGIRWFSFDPNEGFSLNGQPLKLIGTNRHQDFKGKGWALTDDYILQDLKLMKDMGANFLRVSHYPQDPTLMDLCDRLGLLVSVEIPIVNAITESEDFLNNSLNMQQEMIKQNFNHPSVIIWTYMNEVMLQPPYNYGSPEYKAYCNEVNRQAQAIEDLSKSLDPSRYTMIPFHNGMNLYEDAKLFDVPDIIGWNLYHGWYSGACSGLEWFLDNYHSKYPNKPTIISEYGADCDVRLHSDEPQRFDYTIDYADIYHEHYLNTLSNTDYVAGGAIWNLNDFHSESRGYAVPHANLKGIVTMERKPKNTYYLYKANLTEEPFVEFSNSDWTSRSAQLDSLGFYNKEIKIYTNQPAIKLIHNGKAPQELTVNNGIAKGVVALQNGRNNLVALGDSASATLNIDLLGIPYLLDDNFTEISVLMGSNRSFTNSETGVCWIPDKEWTPGSWGYIGGEPLLLDNWVGKLPTSDIDILGSDEDPLYQTQRRGLESMRFDVPDGRYSIILRWADLTKDKYEVLAYNLGNDAQHEESDDAFDVIVNGKTILPALDVRQRVGRQRPLDVKVEAVAADGQGITIDFNPVKGQTYLNAIRIIRL